MKNKFNFSDLFKFSTVAAGVITLCGVLFLIFFGGHTEPTYNLHNLSFGFFLKAFLAALISVALIFLYFLIRYRKDALRMTLLSALGVIVSAVTAFSFCAICGAHLGNLTFAVMLTAVLLSFITFITFAHGIDKKSDGNPAFSYLSVVLLVSVVVLAVLFVVSMIFSATNLALYVLPTILTVVFSTVFTLSVPCVLYNKNISKKK